MLTLDQIAREVFGEKLIRDKRYPHRTQHVHLEGLGPVPIHATSQFFLSLATYHAAGHSIFMSEEEEINGAIANNA